MCGSRDLVKQEGVFVCQSCGIKYSAEEVRKMIIEGTVEVRGTVQIDQSTTVENLLVLARQAVGAKNYASAEEYANRVLEIGTSSSEAWLIKAESVGFLSTFHNNRFHETLKCFEEYYSLLPQEERDQGSLTIVNILHDIFAKMSENLSEQLNGEFEKISKYPRNNAVEVQFGVDKIVREIMRSSLDILKTMSRVDEADALASSLFRRIDSLYQNSQFRMLIFPDGSRGTLYQVVRGLASQWEGTSEQIKKDCRRAVDTEKRTRVRRYWATHRREEAALKEEKDKCNAIIDNTQLKIINLPERQEMERLESGIKDLITKQSNLGIFRGKEKKELSLQIDRLKEELMVSQQRLDDAIIPLEAEIGVAQRRIEEIQTELTRER